MTSLAGHSFAMAATWCFLLTVTSAIVPWVNAEVIVVSLPAVADSRAALLGLVLIATTGQMAGKCVVYWTSRYGTRAPSPRLERRINRWKQRFECHPWAPALFVLVSSVVGLPPFYLTTMLAGILRMPFALYLAAGTLGRLIRFGALVAGAEAFMRS